MMGLEQAFTQEELKLELPPHFSAGRQATYYVLAGLRVHSCCSSWQLTHLSCASDHARPGGGAFVRTVCRRVSDFK
jgi:hypothetical protein